MPNITKDEILNHALELFNQNGISNVSMRDIADACGISVGNLTYHFHRKKDMILAIVEQQMQLRKQYPSTYHMGFVEFMQYVDLAEKLRSRYIYYYDGFVDIARMYKEVNETQRRVHKEVADYFTRALYSFEALGLIRPEIYPSNYMDIANGLIMVTSFWGHHVALSDKGPMEHAYQKKVLWALLVPCMTEKGLTEFQEKIEPLLNE